MRTISLLFSLDIVVGCGRSGAGSHDAGSLDAGRPDSGPDAAPPDSGAPDVATSDAGGDGALADAGRACIDGASCPVGDGCVGGFCEPLECHPGSRLMTVPARESGEGLACDLLLPGVAVGVCVPYAPACTFDSDCAFAFRCVGTCVRSDCHAGTDVDHGDYATRPCVLGSCEFGDGADLNGGRGQCL